MLFEKEFNDSALSGEINVKIINIYSFTCILWLKTL